MYLTLAFVYIEYNKKKKKISHQKTLVPVANKLSQNKYLNAISGGCMSTLGIIMLGAVFTILTNIS